MANILDLAPDAFMQAMEELNLPEADQTRLREQYRQKNSSFSGVKEVLAPEEGRNTGNFVPVSVPEGQSIAEGVMGGDWKFAVPEGFSGGVTGALEGIEAPGQIASGMPYSQQELEEAAWKTAGTAGAGSLAFSAPEGANRMFGGMRARNYPWDRHDAKGDDEYAQSLKGKKQDPDTAWEDYGVEDGPEGARFQIDPKGASVRTPYEVDGQLDNLLNQQDSASFDMKEVFEFPELFDNYPVLGNFRVSVRSKDKNGKPMTRGGWFDATSGEIVVGRDTAKDPEDFRSVMLHELQHGVQAVENTSGGAATSHFFREDPKTGTWETNVKDLEEPVKKLNVLRDRVIDADVNYGRESDTYKETWAEYVEKYRDLNKLAWKKYLTNPGEVEARAAQLWDQLSSEEKRTTRPSSVEKQALGLLKKEYGDTNMPTARLSNTYAEGGMVQGTNMDNEMTKLFAEGGLNTGDAQVDPISGNEVPPGSLPEEVRDDVDAKLSTGEYVVPADVLRFYGVAYFEKLRKRAKEGLAQMDKDGRIGGDPEEEEAPEMEEEEDDFPFGEEDLMFEEEGEELEMADGGLVPPGGIKTFDPSQYAPGFSIFGNPPQQNIENKTYTNAQGQQITIQFINGQPQQPIPAGYFPPGQAPTQNAVNGAVGNPLAPSKPDSPSRDERRGEQTNRTGTGGEGPDWAAGRDWSKMSAADATKLASERLEGSKVMKGLGAAAGLLGPVAGIVGGAAANLRPYAEANALEKVLRAQGNVEAADAVGSLVDSRLADAKLGIRTLEPMLANGTGIAKSILANATTTAPVTAPAVATRATNAPAKTGGSADGRTVVKSGDATGGQGAAKGTISGPTGGDSQKKGAPPTPSRPAPSAPARSAPAKTASNPTPDKSRGGGKPRGGRATGGLVERRKK